MRFDRIAFAARRRKAQDDIIATLEPVVGRALDTKQSGSETWWRAIVDAAHPLFDKIVRDDGGHPDRALGDWARLSLDLTHTLTKTRRIDEYTHTLIATWLATDILSAATIAAAKQDSEEFELEWVSMHDGKVRHTHRDADGQRVPVGVKFRVGTSLLSRPGDSTAPMKEWVNCRCTVAPVPVHDNAASTVDTEAASTQGAQMTQTIVAASEVDSYGMIPWHGVLAPEGVWSGDRRQFAEGSLTTRDLPLPLTYQPKNADGHDEAVVVGRIEWTEKRGNLMYGGGHMLTTPAADEAIGMMADFGKYGVSVDADKAEMGLAFEDGSEAPVDSADEPYGVKFSEARVCSASMVSIPAFDQAYVTMGLDPDHIYEDAEPDDPATEEDAEKHRATIDQSLAVFAVSSKPWDGSAGRFTPEQWKRSCILHVCDGMEKSCHKLPIKEPNGDLSKAGVHAAAARINQVDAPSDKVAAAKRALRSAYSTLGEEPPDVLKASFTITDIEPIEDALCLHEGCTNTPTMAVSSDNPLIDGLYCAEHAHEHENQPLALDEETLSPGETVQAGRGPGWVTNPEDTKRIHDYWTVPGQPGYEKVQWGVDGDFNRCRVEVGQEIGEDSPEKLRFINQICAQWHHDATGFWPGHAPTETALERPDGEMAPALTLVSSSSVTAPSEWFADPGLDTPTPIQITEEGRVFGHLAYWNTCHMNFGAPGTCITPPPSASNYAYFRTGEVLTDKGPVATGPLTIGGGHAAHNLGIRAAISHYDSTSTAVADVACGEDDHGIWVAGWVRPWMSEEKVYELRAASLSGDWRRVPGTEDMELIAALGVNSPGFPAARVGVNHGTQVSLVAAAPVAERETEAPVEDLAEAIAAAMENRAKRRETVAALVGVFDDDEED